MTRSLESLQAYRTVADELNRIHAENVAAIQRMRTEGKLRCFEYDPNQALQHASDSLPAGPQSKIPAAVGISNY